MNAGGRSFLRLLAVGTAFVASLFVPSTRALAAELQPETLTAWNRYVEAANKEMRVRSAPGQKFLWVDEDRRRLAGLMDRGELQVGPLQGKGTAAVPNGLVHHWVGAVFIPNTTLDQVVKITRDYGHYKEFFNPAVIGSKALTQDGGDDQFSILWSAKVMFISAGVDTNCTARSIQLDNQRSYKIAATTRVQEIQNFGRPNERRMVPDRGNGFIWRLYTISRYDAREGGVVVEIETLALTRDIPGSLKLLVTPMVRKLSRNALLLSLEQTRKAVRSNPQLSKIAVRPSDPSRGSVDLKRGEYSHASGFVR